MGPGSNALFSGFSFVAFVLCCVPLYWHLEAWNVGTCMYMIWSGLLCLMYFINSVVWAGNAINWAPVWCDISARLIIANNVALPAASLCINRRLYHIANPTSATGKTRAEKRHDVIVDLSISLGIPVLQMLLELVVEGHRFDIWEDFGCMPFVYNTYPAYPLVIVWPLAIGMVSAVYCGLTIRAFLKRRKQFQDLMASNKNLTYSRYFRLILLAGVEIMCTIPLSIYQIYSNASDPRGISPWISWENVHSKFYHVDQFPLILYGKDPAAVSALQFARWSTVACALLFFAFFGFADEAKKHYRLIFNSVAKRVGYTTISSGQSSSIIASFPGKSAFAGSGGGFNKPLPVYVTKETDVSRDSMSSYSDKLSTSIYIGESGTFDDIRAQPYTPTDTSVSNSPSPPPGDDSSLRRAENAFDPSSIRKPSVPDAPRAVRPDSELDIV